MEKQVAILYCGTKGLLANVRIDKVTDFQNDFLMVLEHTHRQDVLDVIKSGNFDDKVSSIIDDVAAQVARKFA